jgi:hypothetical protein
VTAERYTVVFTGFLSIKKPGEYAYLTVGDYPMRDGGTLRRGRPPVERLRHEIRFRDLPEGCRRLVLRTYDELWGLQRYGSGRQGNIARVPKRREAVMDFDPDDAQQYLEGVDYPASKEEVASAAEGNGAPDELVGMIQSLGTPEFSGPEQVVTELRAFPQSS